LLNGLREVVLIAFDATHAVESRGTREAVP
jgi:hypothetical protein